MILFYYVVRHNRVRPKQARSFRDSSPPVAEDRMVPRHRTLAGIEFFLLQAVTATSKGGRRGHRRKKLNRKTAAVEKLL